MRERLARASAALAAVLLLAGCASIPDSGSVVAYLPDGSPDRPSLDLLPGDPLPGAGPEAILRGFIEAATSPTGNYQVARRFLTPEFADEWLPQAGVTIDRLADRELVEVADDAWRVEATPVAGLDESGVYEAAESSAPIPLDYTFETVDGEVRIASAPQGVLIDSSNFPLVYSAHALYFYSPEQQDLVPDRRWFAERASVQTSIVRALIAGPADWLDGGVVSAFPSDLRLAPDVVPVTGRVAQVDLSGGPVTDVPALQRMRLQLTASLADVPSVADVQLRINGETAEVPPLDPAPDDVIRIDQRSLVYDGSTFGHLDEDGDVDPILGISEQVAALEPDAASAGPGFDLVAVRDADGVVQSVRRGGDAVPVDEREGQIAPVVDRREAIWTAVASTPSRLRATAPDGSARELQAPWGGSHLDAIAVSRDGTRLVALIDAAGRSQLLAVAILRDDGGRPVALGEPLRLATIDAAGLDVEWADASTVVALAGDGATILTTVEVGGTASVRGGPEGGVALDAGNLARDTRVLRASGELDSSSGVGWQVRATGIRAVASQLQPE